MFTARCYASAVLAMGLCPSVSVSVSVTSRCSTKTAKRRITPIRPISQIIPSECCDYPGMEGSICWIPKDDVITMNIVQEVCQFSRPRCSCAVMRCSRQACNYVPHTTMFVSDILYIEQITGLAMAPTKRHHQHDPDAGF